MARQGLLFKALDVNIQANPTNFGDCIAEAQIIDHDALSAEKIVFTYDAEKQIWNGRSDNKLSGLWSVICDVTWTQHWIFWRSSEP